MCKVNGRQTTSDGKSSHCLWQGELKIWVSPFGVPPVRSPHPHHSTPLSSSLSLLSYTGTCKIIMFKPWSYLRETGQNVPTFFQNTFFFTKTLPILFAKMACLIKKILLKRWYHVVCLVIQDLSSKFTYCLVLTTLLQLIQHSPKRVDKDFLLYFIFFKYNISCILFVIYIHSTRTLGKNRKCSVDWFVADEIGMSTNGGCSKFVWP
jgi:hypothetical protein